jgi:hypothetical protein
MCLWHVQPWYPEGGDWDDEPGPARIVQAETPEEAREIFERVEPDSHLDHWRCVKAQKECDPREWKRAERRGPIFYKDFLEGNRMALEGEAEEID